MKKAIKLFVLGVILFSVLSWSLHWDLSSLKTNIAIAQPVDNFQTLAEGDNLYLAGEIEEAEQLYRQAKADFPNDGTSVNEYVPPVFEASQLREKGQQLWLKAEDGIDKGLDSKVFFNLQTLTQLFPEFVPAHIALAQFCLQEADYCETTAKDKFPFRPRAIMERLSLIYPDDPDILNLSSA